MEPGIILVALILVAGFFGWILIIYTHFFGNKNGLNIPGPTSSNPFLGNMMDVVKAGSLHKYLKQLHKKYGPLTAFWWENRQIVSTCMPDAFSLQRTWSNKSNFVWTNFLCLIGEDTLELLNGNRGQEIRRRLNVALTSSEISHFQDSLSIAAKERINGLIGNKSSAIEAGRVFQKAAFQVLDIVCFASLFAENSLSHTFMSTFNLIWNELEESLSNPKRRYSPEFYDNVDTIRGMARQVIAARQKSNREASVLLDAIIDVSESVDQAVNLFLIFILAGYHPLSNLLCWTAYFLAENPVIQKEIRKSKELLTDFLNETLRIVAICPVTGRVAHTSIDIYGNEIPIGTTVLHAIGVMFEDEQFFSDPNKFNFERMREMSANQEDDSRFKFCPFGFAGNRTCPGSSLSYAAAQTILFELLTAYEVRLKDEDRPMKVSGLVMHPDRDIWLNLKSRHG